jgi:two-component system sensor histidine kinase BaeS
VALLTALVLGAVLLAMLTVHFSSRETDHLERAAAQVVRDLGKAAADPGSLAEVARVTAFGTQARVQLYDDAHRLLADSGSPWLIKPQIVGGGALPVGQAGQGAGQGGQGAAAGAGQGTSGTGQGGAGTADPSSRGSTGSGTARSDKVYERAVEGASPGGVAFVRLSEVPAEGTDVMGWIVAAWAVAAAAAVGAAAAAGYLISTRIARPVVALAEASERMAEGDLSTRAEVTGRGEIGRLAGSFNLMADQVEGTVTALQRFVSDAAHELGTPLTALRADLELAQDAAGTDDERRLVTRALTQEQRLEDLGDGLLQLSRLQTSSAVRRAQAVDVALLLDAELDAFASRAEQASVTLDLDVPRRPTQVLADPDRLRTAVHNLVDNAVKFTPPGGSVALGARPEGGSVLVWVQDDGPGIPPEDQARVFERFYRARATSGAPGSGLGLAIVKASVEACGGTAKLAQTSAGTRIELRLRPAPAGAG